MSTWQEITTVEQWEEAWEASAVRPLVLLKHSTRCPVSSNALKEFEAYLRSHPDADMDFKLVKVIEARPVSNRIAEDTGIKHESPQIFCIKNKEVYWHTSHWSVTEAHMSAVLD